MPRGKYKKTDEHKRKISEALRGNKGFWYGKSPSIEIRQKISKANKGHKHSIEARQKMSEVLKGKFAGSKHPFYGKHHSEETKRKISKAKKGSNHHMYGKHLSEETKQKLRGRHCSEETKGKISKANKGKSHSIETREKIKQSLSNLDRTGEQSGNWRGGKVKKICKTCNKEIYIYPSALKRGKGQFCSYSCSSIWRMKHQNNKDTDIERLMEAELIKQNIPYLKQAPIEGIALVDFLLPNKIIIQCDGGYFHSKKINKGKDIAQDTVLFFKGYKVHRFAEKDIKKSISKCIDKVIKNTSENLKNEPK